MQSVVTLNPHPKCGIHPAAFAQTPSPQPPSTVILLDWDDTLFPNAYLAAKAYSLDDDALSDDDRELLTSLASQVATFLEGCQELPHKPAVLIVTNGEAGWVERSCERFMPQLLPYLRKIRIVSARSLYESSRPIEEWKVACFTAELTKLYMNDCSGQTRHVVSIGDSHFERQAVQVLSSRMPLTKSKSVKFVDRPSVADMMRQLKLVSTYLSHLCTHPDHLDLILSREVLREVAV